MILFSIYFFFQKQRIDKPQAFSQNFTTIDTMFWVCIIFSYCWSSYYQINYAILTILFHLFLYKKMLKQGRRNISRNGINSICKKMMFLLTMLMGITQFLPLNSLKQTLSISLSMFEVCIDYQKQFNYSEENMCMTH